MFINDTYPRAANPDGALQTEADWKVEKTLVKKGRFDWFREHDSLQGDRSVKTQLSAREASLPKMFLPT